MSTNGIEQGNTGRMNERLKERFDEKLSIHLLDILIWDNRECRDSWKTNPKFSFFEGPNKEGWWLTDKRIYFSTDGDIKILVSYRVNNGSEPALYHTTTLPDPYVEHFKLAMHGYIPSYFGDESNPEEIFSDKNLNI